jgi:diguanylate cyclase (GGDEF)-like protein
MLVVIAVGVIGIIGTSASTRLGNATSSDELTTAVVTSKLARDMDADYSTGEAALLTSDPVQRSRLLGSLYTSLLPATEALLNSLERLHADDPAAERAGLERFVGQWVVVRDLLSPTNVAAHPLASLATQLTAAYQPLSVHLNHLLLKEQHDGRGNQAQASSSEAHVIGFVVGAIVFGFAIGTLLLLIGIRRIHQSLEPGQDQAEFADTLQIASDEDEAQQLLQRHLERVIAATTAVVFNRNNSADRLEAVTPLPSGSPLADTLRGAEPRSCLAVRSGRTHHENDGRSALLQCSVCTACPGATSCVPLTVGGEVIGSVLLNRPTPYADAEEQQIRDSVSQAAPVLANLRNLAVAEIRAATDGLTGLPNKRAATDTLKRLFAQASTTRSPLALLLLDLDHFKQINDQRGHAVGDQVLAGVGTVLRALLRTRDFAGRNGGEEFLLLLPDTDAAAALEVAERVRAAIAEISLPGADVNVTTSIGVAVFPDHGSTLDRLERLADAALYLAKRHGRNRVELAEPTAVDPGAGFPELSGNGAAPGPPKLPDSSTAAEPRDPLGTDAEASLAPPPAVQAAASLPRQAAVDPAGQIADPSANDGDSAPVPGGQRKAPKSSRSLPRAPVRPHRFRPCAPARPGRARTHTVLGREFMPSTRHCVPTADPPDARWLDRGPAAAGSGRASTTAAWPQD